MRRIIKGRTYLDSWGNRVTALSSPSPDTGAVLVRIESGMHKGREARIVKEYLYNPGEGT